MVLGCSTHAGCTITEFDRRGYQLISCTRARSHDAGGACSGFLTCGNRAGSQGFEAIDAQQFADWGVDYVKEDSCYAPSDPQTAFAQYALMRDSLNATARPMFFALCGWESWYRCVSALSVRSFPATSAGFKVGAFASLPLRHSVL
jgi:hypothetical protein